MGMDRNDIIARLETIAQGLETAYGYTQDAAHRDDARALREAVDLLKAQEPVEPVHEDERPISPLRCGNCGAFVMITAGYKAKYCFECGRGIRWRSKMDRERRGSE